MAKDKKSFVLYTDLIKVIEKLPDEIAGKLFKLILRYVNDLEVCIDDLLLQIAFEPIKNQLKRDLKKYEETKEERSKSGQLGNLKRYHLDLYKRVKSEDITLKEAQRIAKTRIAEQSDTKLAVNDNVNVNDSVNVSTNVDEKTINNIFLEHKEKYKVYATQLYKDTIFVDSISQEFIRNESKEVIKLTLRKYLGLFLNSLDQTKKIHNNKKEFQQHFPSWMRKQPSIVKVYPKEEEIRYS